MGTIKALLSKNANYIYHMLSVSKCGYNNVYGEKYKDYHVESDLQILKKWDKYITVSGGEHCGELYGICVGIPSSFDNDIMIEYFSALLDLFEAENIKLNFKKYKHIYESAFSAFNIAINIDTCKNFFESCLSLKAAIIEITRAMINNYSIYNEKVWNTSKDELVKAIDKLNCIFSKNDYVDEWEKALGCKYKYDNFFAVICNSIGNGPQAIDISYNKDIFNMSKNYTATVKLVNHEFGIYLLRNVLSETQAFKDFSCYKITESLAEYFNRTITGGHNEFDWNDEYINFYKFLRDNNPSIGAKEMFLKAKEKFVSK